MLESFVRFQKKDGKLHPCYKEDERAYKEFIDKIPNNKIVDVYITCYDEEIGTLPQLAKIHAMIREIAEFTKQGFNETKDNIKEVCGIFNIVSSKPYQKKLKSFGDCSIEELNMVINKLIEIQNIIYSNEN